jgi:threonine aldolase
MFEWIPQWLFSATFFIALVLYLVTKTVKILPYAQLLQGLSILVASLSLYLLGAKWRDQVWHDRAQALQQQVLELQAKSQEENVKIVERVVTKRETIRERGQDIIQYVDRVVVKDNEVVKYVEHCPKLPQTVVDTINKAAKP